MNSIPIQIFSSNSIKRIIGSHKTLKHDNLQNKCWGKEKKLKPLTFLTKMQASRYIEAYRTLNNVNKNGGGEVKTLTPKGTNVYSIHIPIKNIPEII